MSPRVAPFAVPATWLSAALGTAQCLDPEDPAGQQVSQRELHAAGAAVSAAIREQVRRGGDPEARTAWVSGRAHQVHAQSVASQVPAGPTLTVAEAMTRLRAGSQAALAQEQDPAQRPVTAPQAEAYPPITVLPSPTTWADSSVYHLVLDRFADGDPDNNGRGKVGFDPQDPRRSHGGDLRGVIDRLDYIRDLGHDVLWLGPIYVQWGAAAYHGYHPTDFLAVDPRLGTTAELRELVDEAHTRGMRVMLDVVVQHMAPVMEYREPRADAIGYSDTPRDDAHLKPEARDSIFPLELRELESFNRRGVIRNWQDPAQRVYGDFQSSGEGARFLPDLDTSNPVVQRAMAAQLGYWLKATGVDLFRLDTAGHLPVEDHHAIMARVKTQWQSAGASNVDVVFEQYHHDWAQQRLLAQSTLSPHAPYRSPLNFPFYFGLHDVLRKGAGTTRLVEVLEGQRELVDPNLARNFVDNHDRERFLHRGSNTELQAALTLMYAWPGVPVVYYGTEQGFSGGDDPANREDMFDHFNPAHPLYREISQLNQLRRDVPALRRGTAELLHVEHGPVVGLLRKHEESEVCAVANLSGAGTEVRTLSLRGMAVQPGDVLADLRSGERFVVTRDPSGQPCLEVALPAYGALLLQRSTAA